MRPPAARRLLTLLLLAGAALLGGCARETDEEARLAVKRLVEAPEGALPSEMDRAVGFGRAILPDIEQEMHGAEKKGRLRLLDALERLGEREALPLVEIVARHDNEETVRRRAAAVARRLRMAPR